MYSIATAHQIGMTLTFDKTTYSLAFRSYKGQEYTYRVPHMQKIVRFSPDLDTLTDVKELQSIADHKTEIYVYVPANPGGMASTPGYAGPTPIVPGGELSEFDIRVGMVFAEDITTIGDLDPAILLNMLNQKATEALRAYKVIQIVDGQVVPNGIFSYGADYNLGDIVEVEGYSGVVKRAMVTEYIRSQDSNGYKEYPTLETID